MAQHWLEQSVDSESESVGAGFVSAFAIELADIGVGIDDCSVEVPESGVGFEGVPGMGVEFEADSVFEGDLNMHFLGFYLLL